MTVLGTELSAEVVRGVFRKVWLIVGRVFGVTPSGPIWRCNPCVRVCFSMYEMRSGWIFALVGSHTFGRHGIGTHSAVPVMSGRSQRSGRHVRQCLSPRLSRPMATCYLFEPISRRAAQIGGLCPAQPPLHRRKLRSDIDCFHGILHRYRRSRLQRTCRPGHYRQDKRLSSGHGI